MGCGTRVLPAADATWVGGTGTQAWATDANWNPAAAPGAITGTTNADTATFNSNVAGTAITIDPNRNIKNLAFGAAAAGAISIGSDGVSLGNALLLSSGGALTTALNSTAIVTVNAPLIVQPTSPTGNGSYTFTNNSASADNDANAYKIFLNGNISGAATTGTITLNFGGSAGNRSGDSSGNEVNGVISNGLAGSVAVNVSTLSNQRGVWKFTNANNSYTGSTTLATGTLIFTSIANAGVNSAIGAGSTIVIGSGAHFKYAGATASTDRAISGSGTFYNQTGGTTLTLTGSVGTGLAFRGGGNFVITSAITGAGGFSRTDSGTVTFGNDGNSFSGDLSVSDGAFRGATLFNTGVNSAFGKGAQIGLGQASGTIGRLEYTGVSTTSNRLILLTNGTSGTAAVTGRGVIDVTTAGETLTLTGGIRVTDASSTNIGEITLRGAGNGDMQGQIGGIKTNTAAVTAIKVVKEGLGTWTLSAANTYTRETTVSAGVLNIRNSAALGTVLSNEAVPTAAGAGTTVASGATLQLQGGISVGAEVLSLNGTGAAGQTGALVNVSGTNSYAGTITLAGNTTISSDSGRLNLTSATALNGSAASRTLTLAGAGEGSISAGLGANISTLTKAGAGLWTVGGTLAHTGATTVSAGTLNVTGSITGTALTTVSSGGTLAGTASLAGGLTVANGGALSMGNAEVAGSTGTLTVAGTLLLNNISTLRFDLGTSSDLIQANGPLTLDGVVVVTPGAGFTTGTYKLIDYTGTLTDNGLTAQMLAGYDLSVAVDTANTDVNLVVSAITALFWDGGDTVADGVVDGGSGIWTNANTNWTSANGSANSSWGASAEKIAIFDGATGGTVQVQDTVAVNGLQFGKNYTLAAGGGSIQLTNTAAEVRVVSGVAATIAAPVTGTGGINKTGEGTLVFTAAAGANVYSGATLVSAGTLKIGATNTLPTGTVLTVGSSGAPGSAGSVAALDMTEASQQVAGFNVSSHDPITTQNSVITIGAGQTLSVTGTAGMKIGVANSLKKRTQAVFTGGGALVVNNTAANFEAGLGTTGTNVPGVTTGTAPDDGVNKNDIVASLAGLGSFTTNVNEFRVAYGLNANTVLTLSNTANDITANTVNLGNSAGLNGGNGSMILGAGTNVITANTLNIGVSKGGFSVAFASTAPGSAGTVVMGGKTPGTGIDITLGATLGTSTGATPGGTLDLTGHIATITADDVVLGNRNVNNNGGATGILIFDGGTFTARTVDLGRISGNGGTAATTVATRGRGDLTISGGTFTVNAGGSFTLATYSNTNGFGSTTGTLTISGGTLISNVDILEGGGAQATTTNTISTINLSGGILDMTGHNIGDATNTINNLNLTAGTLKDVGQINGGGDITKTGTGTLVIQGDSGYTGATAVSAGTLLVSGTPGAATGSTTGTGNVSVASTATLGGNGRIAGSVTLASGTTLAPGGNATTIASAAPAPGLGTDTGTLRILGDLSVASSATLAFNLKTAGNHGLAATFDPVTNRLTSVSGTSTDGGNDRLVIDGAFSLDAASAIAVTAGTGFAPGYQDTFDLLDWTGAALPLSYYDDGDGIRTGGTTDNASWSLDLPDLTGYNTGWFWDVSQFGTTGVIAIVPEPSHSLLALVGIASLMLRRRRRHQELTASE